MRALAPCLLALSLGAAMPPALAGDDCDVPVQQWQPRDAVLRMAAAQGWQVQRLKIDDGCYELRATDAQGRPFKARIDPQTLAVLKIKPRDGRRERERERRRGQHPDD
ncbi:MAG: PepSY domain-containing protein [Proteobacteria bacterium]|nr:PepSY domain-containing protein [Pseudomonadota bacterium]